MSKAVCIISAIAVAFTLLCSGSGECKIFSKNKGKKKMLLVAHRGESYIAPENTLAAFNQAWKTNVPGVELDCYLTTDKRIICIHDGNTKRTSGVDHVVKDTDSATLRKLDVGKWKGEQYAGEKMPFVEEAFATIPKGGVLFCEVKCGPEILPYLQKAIDDSGKRSQITVISFNFDLCAGSKKIMPDVPVYFLKSSDKDPKTGELMPYPDDLIKLCLDNKLDGLNLEYRKVDKELVDKVHAAGLRIYAWTCDDADAAKGLVAAGVDGITTNRAAWMAEQLGIK